MRRRKATEKRENERLLDPSIKSNFQLEHLNSPLASLSLSLLVRRFSPMGAGGRLEVGGVKRLWRRKWLSWRTANRPGHCASKRQNRGAS